MFIAVVEFLFMPKFPSFKPNITMKRWGIFLGAFLKARPVFPRNIFRKKFFFSRRISAGQATLGRATLGRATLGWEERRGYDRVDNF